MIRVRLGKLRIRIMLARLSEMVLLNSLMVLRV